MATRNKKLKLELSVHGGKKEAAATARSISRLARNYQREIAPRVPTPLFVPIHWRFRSYAFTHAELRRLTDPPFQRMLFSSAHRRQTGCGNREEPSLSKRRLIDNGTAFPPSAVLPSLAITRPCRYNYYSSYLSADLHYI